MLVEAVIAITVGVMARSVLLTAFGIDSVIELVSGGVLLWRLSTEARGASVRVGMSAARTDRWSGRSHNHAVCTDTLNHRSAPLWTCSHDR